MSADHAREVGASGLVRRVLALAPGQCRPYDAAEWLDAIVLVVAGVVEVEGTGGARQRFARGDLLWLTGLPVHAVHNPGDRPAVLVAVSRPATARRAGALR